MYQVEELARTNILSTYHIKDVEGTIRWVVIDDVNKPAQVIINSIKEWEYELADRVKHLEACKQLLQDSKYKKLAKRLETISTYHSLISESEEKVLHYLGFELKDKGLGNDRRKYTRGINAINSILYTRIEWLKPYEQ